MLPRSTAPFNQIHAVSQSLQEICEICNAQQSLIKANKQNYFVHLFYISLGNQIKGGKIISKLSNSGNQSALWDEKVNDKLKGNQL